MCKTMLLLCCVDSNELDESAASSVVFTELLAKQVSSSFYSMEHILKVAQVKNSIFFREAYISLIPRLRHFASFYVIILAK